MGVVDQTLPQVGIAHIRLWSSPTHYGAPPKRLVMVLAVACNSWRSTWGHNFYMSRLETLLIHALELHLHLQCFTPTRTRT